MKGTQNQHVSISEDLPDFSLLHRMFSIEHGRSPYSDFGVSKGGVLNYTIRHTKKRKIDTDSGMLLPTRCRDDSTGNNNIPQKAPGLLKSSYLPDDDGEALRIIVRYRKTLTQDCNHFILRMQKAMELMNLKLHTVINDITGQSGLAVIGAIVAGERNPEVLQQFVGKNVKVDRETILKSLQGTWRNEQVFC